MGTPKKPTHEALMLKKARVAYDNAKHRCKKDPSYQGIKFLFGSFKQFLAEVGIPKSSALSLDRIDPNGHYAPGNVRWADASVQAKNKKTYWFGTFQSAADLHAKALLENEAAADRAKLSAHYFGVTRAYNGLGYKLPSDSTGAAIIKKIWDENSFGPNDLWHPGIDQLGVFHIPSLTLPGGVVRGVGGPLNPAPVTNLLNGQQEHGLKWWRRGLIYTLGNLPLRANLAEDEVADLLHDIAEGSPGAIWHGNPSEHALAGGWIESRMLAAACRLFWKMKGGAAYLPALHVLEQIDQAHGKLDECTQLNVKYLFIPDAQIDCGAGWTTTASELYTLAKLLDHRRAKGLKTFYGMQNLNKLGGALENKLLVLKPREFSAASMNPHPDPVPIKAELKAKFPPPEEGWFG